MGKSEQRVVREIENWEQNLNNKQRSDFTSLYDDWLKQAMDRMNPVIKHKFFNGIDNFLFYTHALLQGPTFQQEKRDSIIASSRIFNPEINKIQDLKKLSIDELTYLAKQQVSTTKFASMVQGGLTGTGGYLFLGIDFPLMLVTNLRVVQLIGLSFGHEINHPYEMMLSLKVFHAATMPRRYQTAAWAQLNSELKKEKSYLYDGEDELTDHTWLDLPLKQVMKTLLIVMTKRKALQGIPFISVGVGAYMNYQLTRNVEAFALHYYQNRYIKQMELN